MPPISMVACCSNCATSRTSCCQTMPNTSKNAKATASQVESVVRRSMTVCAVPPRDQGLLAKMCVATVFRSS